MSSILSDTAIAHAFNQGDIKINPWVPEQLNSSSYDIRLGDQVAVYKGWVETWQETMMKGYPVSGPSVQDGRHFKAVNYTLNVKQEPEIEVFPIDPTQGWVLKPGIGYLMHTMETVATSKYVPILDGKSSIGRLFVQIHATAGFGDPGFDGQFTLEVIVQHPIRVYPGMLIGQVRFQTIEGKLEKPYNLRGNYRGDKAMGPVPSQAFRQFQPKKGQSTAQK